MQLIRTLLCSSSVLACLTAVTCHAADTPFPQVAEFLKHGQLKASDAFLRQQLDRSPGDAQARFYLGIVKFLAAVEHLIQQQHRYGAFNTVARTLPILRLPVPANPAPEEISYAQMRTVFANFQDDLNAARTELEKVDSKSAVRLTIDLESIHLDFDGDGKAAPDESFLSLFGVLRPFTRTPAGTTPLVVTFDAGDVLWLQGYCHFLAGFCDIVLAYDHQRLFDHCGQLVYPRPIQAEPFVVPLSRSKKADWWDQILDVIAAVHLIDLPLKEPARLASARKHWLEMIRTSRESWTFILAETDNEQEWLPNPKQTGVLRIPVTRELIDGWQAVLGEMEDLLEGRKLVPYWRDHSSMAEVPPSGRGVNLKRFFEEPRRFDLVLWIHGSAALPYVEEGELSHPQTWNQLTRVFQGNFFGFAAWFN